jgi:hypothetical protein
MRPRLAVHCEIGEESGRRAGDDLGHVKTRFVFDYEAIVQIIADFLIRATQGWWQQRFLLPHFPFGFYAVVAGDLAA